MTGRGQGETIREARQAARMTQAHLAQASCVSLSTIKRAERGDSVSDENLRAVCSVLGIEARGLPRPAALGPQTDILAGEFVDLDAAGHAALSALGPVIAASRCRADLWLKQSGRPAARSIRDLRSLRVRPLLRAVTRTAVAWLAILAAYFVGWGAFLGHEVSTPLVAAVSLSLGCAAIVIACLLRVVLRDEQEEEFLVDEMSLALAKVGAVTRTAFVGFVETDGVAGMTVIPWEGATIRLSVEGDAATITVEGNGGSHAIEGLAVGSSFVEEIQRRAGDRLRSPATVPPFERRRRFDLLRLRRVDYVTRIAPGYTWSRAGDTIHVHGPGRRPIATLFLRPKGVQILADEPLCIQRRDKPNIRTEQGVKAWVPLGLAASFTIVRGTVGYDPRLANGWADATPGFVLSGHHVTETRTSLVALIVSNLGMTYAMAAAAIIIVALPLGHCLDSTIGETAMRRLQDGGMGYEAARRAASPFRHMIETIVMAGTGR